MALPPAVENIRITEIQEDNPRFGNRNFIFVWDVPTVSPPVTTYLVRHSSLGRFGREYLSYSRITENTAEDYWPNNTENIGIEVTAVNSEGSGPATEFIATGISGEITVTATGGGGDNEYLWIPDTEFLNATLISTTTRIGNSAVTEEVAVYFENAAVAEIQSILSVGFKGVYDMEKADVPRILQIFAARWVAVQTQMITIGQTLGSFPANFLATRYHVYSELVRMVLARNEITLPPLVARDKLKNRQVLNIIRNREIEGSIILSP